MICFRTVAMPLFFYFFIFLFFLFREMKVVQGKVDYMYFFLRDESTIGLDVPALVERYSMKSSHIVIVRVHFSEKASDKRSVVLLSRNIFTQIQRCKQSTNMGGYVCYKIKWAEYQLGGLLLSNKTRRQHVTIVRCGGENRSVAESYM